MYIYIYISLLLLLHACLCGYYLALKPSIGSSHGPGCQGSVLTVLHCDCSVASDGKSVALRIYIINPVAPVCAYSCYDYYVC